MEGSFFSREEGPKRNTVSFLVSAARVVARGTVKPRDQRYRNRLPWLSYVICFTSRAGQHANAAKRAESPSREGEDSFSSRVLYCSFTTSFTIALLLSARPTRWQSSRSLALLVSIETVFLIAIDRLGRGEKKERKREKKKQNTCRAFTVVARLAAGGSCSFAGSGTK